MSQTFMVIVIAFCLSFYLFKKAGCTLYDSRPHALNSSSEPLQIERDPIQVNLAASEQTPIIRYVEGHRLALIPQAKFKIAGRVLSKKKYYFEWQAKLSPLDLAIGWNKFATNEYDRFLNYDHGSRFFHWTYLTSAREPAMEVVNRYTSNTHIISANKTLELALKSINVNEFVELSGLLVNIEGQSPNSQGFSWRTSMVRDDTAGGACELMYVEKLRIGSAVY